MILRMGIAEHHCQAFVAGEFLDGFDIGAEAAKRVMAVWRMT